MPIDRLCNTPLYYASFHYEPYPQGLPHEIALKCSPIDIRCWYKQTHPLCNAEVIHDWRSVLQFEGLVTQTRTCQVKCFTNISLSLYYFIVFLDMNQFLHQKSKDILVTGSGGL
jgi:hypothetical protein